MHCFVQPSSLKREEFAQHDNEALTNSCVCDNQERKLGTGLHRDGDTLVKEVVEMCWGCGGGVEGVEDM